MTMLHDFHAQTDRNLRRQMMQDWLFDDSQRAQLYAELHQADFPIVPCPTLIGPGQADVYLVSGRTDVLAALEHGSVQPYAALDSGGRFMLGLDKRDEHGPQNRAAVAALRYPPAEVERLARVAVERALVWPGGQTSFDLAQDFAEQVALRFVALLFGLPVQAHAPLQAVLGAAYRGLVFRIVGRHFLPDQPSPSEVRARLAELLDELRHHVRSAMNTARDARDQAGPVPTVIEGLASSVRSCGDAVMIALGLMAGTAGNARAAICIATRALLDGPPGDLQAARDEARSRPKDLAARVMAALVREPPAPFLARVSTPALSLSYAVPSGVKRDIPEGAPLLLLIGADADCGLVFGHGGLQVGPMHRCIGEHLAWPLVTQAMRSLLLRLPGLAQSVDPVTGRPRPLEKGWGAICERYRVQYQRGRRLAQQPLYVVLPIKPPVEENARILERITRDGAHVVQHALDAAPHVHFAWFNLVENRTHLAMTTVYDGDFDAYVRHFALTVPLFDIQFDYLDCELPRPIREHPDAFVEAIRRYNRAPLGGYFYSAYPDATVADVMRDVRP